MQTNMKTKGKFGIKNKQKYKGKASKTKHPWLASLTMRLCLFVVTVYGVWTVDFLFQFTLKKDGNLK